MKLIILSSKLEVEFQRLMHRTIITTGQQLGLVFLQICSANSESDKKLNHVFHIKRNKKYNRRKSSKVKEPGINYNQEEMFGEGKI